MIYESKHGGDIYNKVIVTDFSVNVNPLGMPESVLNVIKKEAENCSRYPDIFSRELIKELAEYRHTDEEYITCGNGASELFMAIVRGIKPDKVLLIEPSFLGYEYAVNAMDASVLYYNIAEKNFKIDRDILGVLTKDIDMIFLANPNNPTGIAVDYDIMLEIIKHCKEEDIIVILDECFIDLSDNVKSMKEHVEEFDNLIIVNAFTKTYGLAGIRLGYMICADNSINIKVRKNLPEWNISYIAQKAGAACFKEEEYLRETKELIKREKSYLVEKIRENGIEVYDSCTNFLLLKSNVNLYEEMLKQGILIRDCSNYRGLEKGYYRIAIKKHEENEKFIEAVEKVRINIEL
ncbi:MAG: aminotransferase class I/II-fold pyridoxal phosphate-dependent enzyme [Lachnospiraceae bacterium]|nr:aminotransferase class I/II-fold pyridoxal phosphate-dependent enzyme [Lachnospiraceae bacterium]